MFLGLDRLRHRDTRDHVLRSDLSCWDGSRLGTARSSRSPTSGTERSSASSSRVGGWCSFGPPNGRSPACNKLCSGASPCSPRPRSPPTRRTSCRAELPGRDRGPGRAPPRPPRVLSPGHQFQSGPGCDRRLGSHPLHHLRHEHGRPGPRVGRASASHPAPRDDGGPADRRGLDRPARRLSDERMEDRRLVRRDGRDRVRTRLRRLPHLSRIRRARRGRWRPWWPSVHRRS